MDRMALADALSFHQVFAEERVWIDLGFFVAFVAIHTISNWTSPALPSDDAARMASFSFVREIAGAGLTAAGILLPLSLAAVGTFAAESRPDEDVLTNVFIGDAWLTLSLS
jgi:hypothetical protein